MKIISKVTSKYHILFTIDFDDTVKEIVVERNLYEGFIQAVQYGREIDFDFYGEQHEVPEEELLIKYKSCLNLHSRRSENGLKQIWSNDSLGFSKELLCGELHEFFHCIITV